MRHLSRTFASGFVTLSSALDSFSRIARIASAVPNCLWILRIGSKKRPSTLEVSLIKQDSPLAQSEVISSSVVFSAAGI